jgi:hypothetical protein
MIGLPMRAARGLLLALLVLALASALRAQAVKGSPPEDAPPPPLTYHGLIPGVSSAEEVRAKLGAPAGEASWYAWKMLYPAKGRPGRFDAVYLQGGAQARLANIEAASVPEGLETLERARERLGEPELELRYPSGQRLLDWSEKGVRFTFDREGKTTGVAYFPHGYRRVHEGERRRLDLGQRVAAAGPTRASLGPLEAGAAEVDISPREPGWLPKPFTVHDPMKARIAVLRAGELKVALVGADLFGMLKSEIDPIEARLREKGLSHLIVAMSHNHAAPDTIGIYGHYPKEYVAFIQERLESGVIEALGRLRPVEGLRAAALDLELDGARVEGLFRNARNPGIVDPQLAAVELLAADGKPLVTMVHFACHVEGLEKGWQEISADFVGYLCERLRERRGTQAIFLNGAVGGMVTGDTRARTHEEARAMGERLAAELESLLERAGRQSGATLSLRRIGLEVPVTNPRFIAFQQLAGAERRPWSRGRLATEMFHLTIGPAEIITVPGELLPEVSFEILEHMAGRPRMIVGLANDELGYIIPAYDYRAGFYEESMSVGPVIAPLVKEYALRLLGVLP